MYIAEDLEVQVLPGSGRWMEEMLHKEEQLQNNSDGLTFGRDKNSVVFR